MDKKEKISIFKRIRSSLSLKMYNSILQFSIVLSLVAVALGLYLYSTAVVEQYSQDAYRIAKTSRIAYEMQYVQPYIDKVIRIYESLDESLIENGDSEAYRKAYDSVEDISYRSLRTLMRQIRDENGAQSIYLGVFDKQTNRMIYVVDSDEDFFPGEYDYIHFFEFDRYDDEPSDNGFRNYVPHVVDRSKEYGYLCTSWDVIEENDRYIVLSMCDMDMNRASAKARNFLWKYFLVIALVTFFLDNIIVRRMRRNVIDPIRAIDQAARDYIVDQSEGGTKEDHFAKVRVDTGDEIESLAGVITRMEAEIKEYITNLTAATAEKEKISTELNVARDIQKGAIPSVFPPYPNRKEFDIYATMDPAREVGGDFYDFFMTDKDHLWLVIADVSGKGIPASLFMMAAKIVINDHAGFGMADPAEILYRVNRIITRNNQADMFVTVWIGRLEISTGRLVACNAGHEYPCIAGKNGKFELFKDKHGFVVGGYNDTKYQSYELQLSEGDALFLYTDGVPEATNSEQELFGTERMLEALNKDPEADVEDILKNVREGIDGFVKDAPQFDDITMMALRYHGKDKKE